MRGIRVDRRVGIDGCGCGCRCIKHVLATRHDAFGKGELATSRLADLFGQSRLICIALTTISYTDPLALNIGDG